MPKLFFKFETSLISEINLDKPSFTVGRNPDNDIVLDSTAVSSHHCAVYLSAGDWFVEDLNSANGVFINGVKVVKAGLRDSDNIGIGRYFLTFIKDAPAQSAGATGQTVKPGAKSETELPPQKGRVRGTLEVLDGGVESRTEYELTNLSTYIGKTASANIPYKGSGIFNSGPDIAAFIAMRPEGYYLLPIKEGYATHNGNPLNEKIFLKDEDIIQAGGTRFRFFIVK